MDVTLSIKDAPADFEGITMTFEHGDREAAQGKLDDLLDGQQAQATQLRTLMDRSAELQTEIDTVKTQLTTLVSTSIPAYQAEVARILAEAKAATDAAVTAAVTEALDNDSVKDATDEQAAQALRDAAIEKALAGVAEAHTAADAALAAVALPTAEVPADGGDGSSTDGGATDGTSTDGSSDSDPVPAGRAKRK